MKGTAVILVFVFCYVQCRKTYPPIDKNANLAFINMEGGAGVRPGSQSVPPASPVKPVLPPTKPAVAVAPAATKPVVKPVPQVPTVQPVVPAKPTPPPATKPLPAPHQIKPVPVNPAPVANPITTPGPGSVKQLVHFYDSQGKASAIRPYSYSQAVKQG